MIKFFKALRNAALPLGTGLAVLAAPVAAQQVETIDPDAGYSEGAASGIDGDLAENPGSAPVYADEQAVTDNAAAPQQGRVQAYPEQSVAGPEVAYQWSDPVATSADAGEAASQAAADPEVAAAQGSTYKQDDLIGAAQSVFGEGAEGIARMIENLLDEQGEPNAYIVGREAGGAFIVGARYGSGTLYHKVEGERPVYWTGPSIGFDAGANAGNTFVLVYNLYDTEELYERFPAGEGQAYALGGVTASYLRKGDTVLIPIRVGAGLRLGVNAGYMKFSKKQRWLPF
jgi:hypothetical protein